VKIVSSELHINISCVIYVYTLHRAYICYEMVCRLTVAVRQWAAVTLQGMK